MFHPESVKYLTPVTILSHPDQESMCYYFIIVFPSSNTAKNFPNGEDTERTPFENVMSSGRESGQRRNQTLSLSFPDFHSRVNCATVQT